MRVCKMRHRLQQLGYTMEQQAQGFMVTDGAVKSPLELHFDTLEAVEQWVTKEAQKVNRLTEDECLQWDKDFEDFCNK